MIQSYPLRAAAALWLTVAGATLVSVTDVRAQTQQAAGCDDPSELAVLPSPLAPWKGAPLRIIFAAEKPLDGELSLIAPNGQVAVTSRERRGGPPYFWLAEVASPAAGKWQAQLTRANAPAECRIVTREIAVAATQPPRPSGSKTSVWPIRNSWNLATENLYSAWIEKLFEAPLDAVAVMAGAACRAARSRAQPAAQSSRPARRLHQSLHPPRLRRPAVFPARLFRLQDGPALRLREMHAWRRRQPAALPGLVEYREGRAAARSA